MKHVNPGMGICFRSVEDELWDTFLPYLFQGDMSHIPVRAITSILVKKDGIALPDPNHTCGPNCTVSYVVTGHLFAALCGTSEFRSGDHVILMEEGKEDTQQRHTETSLGESQATASKKDSQRMGRINRMGAWLSVILSTFNGMELGAQ